mmetsp:Transcript_30899/g.88583  ORF Transcript_30899/g.88583 Transcript_30899/m.88583 type:complete len:260 (-) Transcript_30899:38-817(-)
MLLKPHACLKVKVICGLVQKQQRGRRKERLCQRNAHAPTPGHVLRLAVHGDEAVREAQPRKDLSGPGLRTLGVKLREAVRDGVDALVIRPELLHDLGLELLEALRLLPDVRDDGLHGRLLRGRRFLVQVEDVDGGGQRQISLRDGSHHVALAAAVLAQEAIATALGQLDVAVLDELPAGHLHAEVHELHVPLCIPRCQDPSHGPQRSGASLSLGQILIITLCEDLPNLISLFGLCFRLCLCARLCCSAAHPLYTAGVLD